MDEELAGKSAEDKYFTVRVDETSQCKRTLTLDVTDDALQAEKKRISRKLQSDLEVPGFRKGKVPASYIAKNFAGAVHGDAVQNLLSRAYEEAVLGGDLHPLGEPKFEELKTEDGEGISVKAHIEVRPEIEITNYTGVKVEAEKKVVEEEQVDKTLESLRESMAAYEPVDRPAAGDDYLSIDFVPYLESGELDEAARQQNYGVTLDGQNLLPEFKQELPGMKPGEEKEILVKYPDDFPEKSLGGSSKSFLVTVNEVKEKLVPEMDDAFAKNVSAEVGSLADLRKRILDDLQREEDTRYMQDVQERIIDKIIENNSFEVPEAMVDNYLTSILEDDRRRRPHVESENDRESQVREMFREPATRMVRRYFIIEAVVRQEELSVTKEELDKKIAQLAEHAGRPVEEVETMFRDKKHLRNLESDLLDEKVLNFLREKADIKIA